MSRLSSLALRGVARALASTWRFEIVGADHLARARASGGFIYALWHRALIPLLWRHRGQGTTLLVSAHADGGMFADVARRWGYRIVRGSSTRGGARGARGLARALAEGREVALTPDGPRGPARSAKSGAVAVALQTNALILPVAAEAAPCWRLASWDALLVPRPFARVRIVYSAPYRPGAGGAGRESAVRELAARLDAATTEAGCPG